MTPELWEGAFQIRPELSGLYFEYEVETASLPALDGHKISYLNRLQRKLLIISHNYGSSRHH